MAEPVDIPPNIMSALQQHILVGAQRQADGASAHAEHVRTAYLIGKDRISFAESTGVRAVEESGSGRARNIDNSGKTTT